MMCADCSLKRECEACGRMIKACGKVCEACEKVCNCMACRRVCNVCQGHEGVQVIDEGGASGKQEYFDSQS